RRAAAHPHRTHPIRKHRRQKHTANRHCRIRSPRRNQPPIEIRKHFLRLPYPIHEHVPPQPPPVRSIKVILPVLIHPQILRVVRVLLHPVHRLQPVLCVPSVRPHTVVRHIPVRIVLIV